MKKVRIDRADGRYLYLYAFERPVPSVFSAEQQTRGDGLIELRWNALLAEHVIVSTVRQERTFLPPDAYCPLCPMPSAESFATEVPSPDFEIAVFENLFPSFLHDAPRVDLASPLDRRVPAFGACEVIVYAPDHDATLRTLSQMQIRRLVEVWTDRYAELSALPRVAYVFIFENRGKEIGVTLTHPHGQIYAFPYVPPRVQQEHAGALEHYEHYRRCLLCDMVAQERRAAARVVAETAGFVAFVPFAARVPYEVQIAATEHRETLLDLTETERDGLASILRDVQATYDALWGFAMPYTMSMHQRATDGIERPGDHLHIEFLPPYRTRDKLKYLAGVETGAGTFINDTSPEEKAAELREAPRRAGSGT